MTRKDVPISEALTFGWETFRNNALFLIGVTIAVALINGAVEIADEYGPVEYGYFGFVINVIEILVNAVLGLGLIAIMLAFKDGRLPEFVDLFNRAPLVFHYVAATILYALMVVVGLVFLIVPGIYLAVRFGYYGYFIVDEEVGPIEALKKSSDLTEGVRMDLFLFGALLIGLNILGLMVLLVGVLVTMPMSQLACAHVFRHLQNAAVTVPVSEGPVSEGPI
jgi:uncharacterized membrane protein